MHLFSFNSFLMKVSLTEQTAELYTATLNKFLLLSGNSVSVLFFFVAALKHFRIDITK